MDNLNSSFFPGISEPDQEFDMEKYLNNLGFVFNDDGQIVCSQICTLPPASDLIDIDQQYKIQDGAIIRCSPWINEQPRPFPFFFNNGRWYSFTSAAYPWDNIDLGFFMINQVVILANNKTKSEDITLLIKYCYGEMFTQGTAILSCNDFKKINFSKAFPWINPQLEQLMSQLIYGLIITSKMQQFNPPKHSGWSIATNGVLFHAQGFDYYDYLRDYYPSECSHRNYLEDNMKVYPKEYLNQSSLPWQVTVANLLRLSSLLLSFYRKESIELKHMFLLHCSEREAADQCVALLKNDRFDSRAAHSLHEKNIDKLLNATNDGVVLFRYEAPLDGKRARVQGLDEIQRDINRTNGIDDNTNHLICVICYDSTIVEQRDLVCSLSLDDVSLNLKVTDIQRAALHSDCRLIQFVKDHWQQIIIEISKGVDNTVIPENIPSHLRNTFLIIQITYELISTNIPELLPTDFDPKMIVRWLSGEAVSPNTDQAITEQFRSAFISLLESKQLYVLSERRDVEGKLNAIAVTPDDVFLDTSTLDKTIMPMIAYDIDRNRLLNALVKTGYLRATDKNEFQFRIHKRESDQKDTWLYCVKRDILGNKNTEMLFMRQNEGKEQFFLYKDEIPVSPFLPLIQYQTQYAGIMLAQDGSDNRHLLISGKSHSGKTFALFHIAAQYASLGHHVIIFDTNGTLKATEIEDHFSGVSDKIKPEYTHFAVKSKGELPVNLLSFADNEDEDEDEDSIADYLYALLSVGLFHLPSSKFIQLQQDISDFYKGYNKEQSNEMSMLIALKDYISTLKSRSILKNNLDFLINLICKYELPDRTWKDLFNKTHNIIVISIPGSKKKEPNPLFHLILFSLYQYQKYASDNPINAPLDIIVDELHDEDLNEGWMIHEIMEEGRHYQIGFAAGTHSFKSEKLLRAVMGNASIKIFLKPDGDSENVLLKHLHDPAIDIEFVHSMKKGKCIVEAEFYSKDKKENTSTVLTGDFVRFGSVVNESNQTIDLNDAED